MRPVDHVERQDSPSERRRKRGWRVFFGCLLLGQMIAFKVFGVEFWWALAGSVALVGLHETFWAVFDRRHSRKNHTDDQA